LDFVDPVTRTVKVRAYVPNRDRRLKAEMFVAARVALPRGAEPMAPARALFLIGNRQFVFVRQSDRSFVRRAVTTGQEFGDAVAISVGLKAGEEVVVTGNLFMQQLFATQRQRQDAGDNSTATPPASPTIGKK